MKWKMKPKPKNGDIRVREAFAWLPVAVNQHTKVWLEFYRLHEVWKVVGKGEHGNEYSHAFWVPFLAEKIGH